MNTASVLVYQHLHRQTFRPLVLIFFFYVHKDEGKMFPRMDFPGNGKWVTVTGAVTWQTSPSNVTRSHGAWEKKGKRSLALGLQITGRDDKRGPNKTQHPSLLNEMSGEGEWGEHNLLPRDIPGYCIPRNAFHCPIAFQWWKMWIQLWAVKVFIWIN